MKSLLKLIALSVILISFSFNQSDNNNQTDEPVEEEVNVIVEEGLFAGIDVENIADDIGLVNYGQSLSTSGNGLLDQEELLGCYNFQGGTYGGAYILYDYTNVDERNTFYGSSYAQMNSEGRETPAKGQCIAVKKLLKDENDFDIIAENKRLIGFSAGVSGAPLSQLFDTNGLPYLNLMESIQKAYDISLSEDRLFEVGAFSYIQGENGNDRGNEIQEHFDLLAAFFEVVNVEIKNITKQTKDVQFFLYQIASHNTGQTFSEGVPLAFTKLVNEIDNVNFGSSMYQYEYVDGIHLTNDSNTAMGISFGAAIKKVVFDKEPYNELDISDHIVSFKDNSYTVELTFDVPYKPLVVNTSLVPEVTNYGFSILNDNDEELITDVIIDGAGKIYIMCLGNPLKLDLTYSIEGYETGGNITDSMNLEYTKEGILRSIDNYLPIIRLTLVND